MSDALTPLRRAYGVEAPGAPAAAAPGAGGHAEAALLTQTRAAVEATVAAQDRQPAAATLDAILAEAARASAAALAPLAAVRALYGEPTDATPDPVEAAVLAQTRAAVEQTVDAHPASPPPFVLDAILAEAAAATARAPRADDAVEAPALAPLAVAYGLPLAAGLAPDGVETELLVQTRHLLDDRPVPAGPSDAVVAAVTARAASFGTLPAVETPEPAVAAPVGTPAVDRAPMRAARSYRRVGAWASAAALALVLIVALMPRTAGAPEAPAAEQLATVAATLPPETGTAETGMAEAAIADATPAGAAEAPAAPLAESFAALAPPPAVAPSVSAPAAPSEPRPVVTPQPAALRAPAPPAPRRAEVPRPAPARQATPRFEANPTTALASADVTPAASDEAWEAPADVRVLSLRLQALGRDNAGLAWDTPAEAFGAPVTSTVGRSTPGLQSVRETARVRLRTEPAPGDR